MGACQSFKEVFDRDIWETIGLLEIFLENKRILRIFLEHKGILRIFLGNKEMLPNTDEMFRE